MPPPATNSCIRSTALLDQQLACRCAPGRTRPHSCAAWPSASSTSWPLCRPARARTWAAGQAARRRPGGHTAPARRAPSACAPERRALPRALGARWQPGCSAPTQESCHGMRMAVRSSDSRKTTSGSTFYVLALCRRLGARTATGASGWRRRRRGQSARARTPRGCAARWWTPRWTCSAPPRPPRLRGASCRRAAPAAPCGPGCARPVR